MSERQIEILEGEGFTVVYNSLIQDIRLRLATRAVLILMLSKPKSWDFSVRGMAAIAGVSKDTMSKMLDELAEAGYLRRKQQGRTRGRFDKGGYIVSGRPVFLADKPELPVAENQSGYPSGVQTEPEARRSQTPAGAAVPCPNFSYTKESYAKKSPQENKEQENTKQDNPPIVPPGDGERAAPRRREKSRYKAEPDWKPERFAGFWKLYPRGENKQNAIRAWDKLKPSDELLETMGKALLRQMQGEDWQRGIGIPYAATWLNNARWEDEQRAAPTPCGGWAEEEDAKWTT